MKTKNLTPMPLGTKVTARRPRRPEMTVIVRGKFRIVHAREAELIEDPMNPLVQGFMTADVFAEDDDERQGESLQPGDFADFKPHPEVLLRGTCYTPLGRPLPECPVKFSVGAWSKSLRVVGRRVFSDGLAGAAASPPVPFSKMPLGWTHAFGGPGFDANPAGKGVDSAELPNVELPGAPVRSRGDRVEPGGYGPINPAWPLRAKKLGKNYGAEWKKERSPFYSDDFDWTHFQSAPPDQWLKELRGDEVVVFQNMHPEIQVLETKLPNLRVRAFVKDVDGLPEPAPSSMRGPASGTPALRGVKVREVRMVLDTLYADLDDRAIYLTWRGLTDVREDDLADVGTVFVASEKGSEEPLPLLHYEEAVLAFEKDPTGYEEAKKRLTPDTSELEKKHAAFEALQKTMKESADDPEALEKTVDAALAIGGEHTETARAQAKEALRTASEKTPGGPPGRSFGEATKKPAPQTNLRLVKPGETPTVSNPEVGGQIRAMKARLPEIEAHLAAAAIPADDLQKIKAAFEDPILAKLGEEPPPHEHPKAGADLSGMDLRGRDLRGADLRSCAMVGTNFTGADLREAVLSGSNLERAILYGANLSHAVLDATNFSMCILSNAIAEGASFKEAKLDRTVFDGATLRGAVLEEVEALMAVFLGSDLEGAKLGRSKLAKCFWNEAKLDDTVFDGASLEMCMVRESQMKRASFVRARFDMTAFVDTDLTGSTFFESKGTTASFERAILKEVDFRHADLFRSHFTGSKAEKARFVSADLRGSRFYRTILTGATFETANLIRCDFSKADLARVKFRGANLYEAKFLGAFGASTDFVDANLKRALMERA
ncbi:MAG: DUF2169 domain-containing protein [Polyangiaceae bacterium]